MKEGNVIKATEAVAKNTRKSTAKDINEPADERAVTPSRRSTRIRSNNISETPTALIDERPITPSRRSARIRSNTSLISETIQNYDSPRAKRAAARRNSQVGSDTETSVTPARQSRRTRKDSSTSVDKVETNVAKANSQISEVIVEEVSEISENVDINIKEKNNNSMSNTKEKERKLSVRTSPKLKENSNEKSPLPNNASKENESEWCIKINQHGECDKPVQLAETSPITYDLDSNQERETKYSDQRNISITSAMLIEQIVTENKKPYCKMNKSSSLTEKSSQIKNKKRRTKSWTTIAMLPTNDSSFYSDSEISKNNTKSGSKNLYVGNKSGSGDTLLNTNVKKNKEDSNKLYNISVNASVLPAQPSTEQVSPSEKSLHINNTDQSFTNKESNKSFNEQQPLESTAIMSMNDTKKILEQAPSGNLEISIYIEDTDSNTGSLAKENTEKQLKVNTACAPGIENQSKECSKWLSRDDNCEPMDIDETILTNTSNALQEEKENILILQEHGVKLEKSAINSPNENDSIDKSQRKSSFSNAESQNLNKTEDKNKSTLVLSQIKDTSLTAETNITENCCITKHLSKSVSVDACAPGIENQSKECSKWLSRDDNCEPMDIDETILTNTSNALQEEKENILILQEHGVKLEKSAINSPNENDSIDKSQRKSSFSNAESQNLNKTEDKNKSTLVLSQIKDTSLTAETNITENCCITKHLSKSVSVDASVKNKDTDKKNLSLTYSTSTPLHQKTLKNFGLQVNTSMITPSNKNKKNYFEKRRNSTSSETDNSISDNDVIEKRNKEELNNDKHELIDDEAEEITDDYESGKSRDDEERQYEIDNEIHDKGETLDSDDDEYSDDSDDYDKGSFIVSSDEVDDELLSGSGDDLSMSVEELSMSLKSKKKYNERKIKEQKKASREMFEARHKLNDSVKNTKSKKHKSKKYNQLVSSDTDDNDNLEEKDNMQQINSSQDISLNANKPVFKKNKKIKYLSDSCEENIISEKEMTVCEEKDFENEDPLLLHHFIKVEPKTPQKSHDISTAVDPLQETALQNKEDNDSVLTIESISENEDITQNYETALKNLNEINKVRKTDMSLDLNKKRKKKFSREFGEKKERVIDQLNLTQIENRKKNKSVHPSENNPKSKLVNAAKDEDLSDSIDMKLLFPENSNDGSESSNNVELNQDMKNVVNDCNDDVTEHFIPLKRTDAKTSIPESPYFPEAYNPEKSKKNKKKRISSQTDHTTSMDKIELEVSIQNNPKKNKKRCNTTENNVEIFTEEVDKCVENNNKKNKKKKSLEYSDETREILPEYSTTVSSKEIKKTEKQSSLIDKDETIDTDICETEMSIKYEDAKENKKKNNGVSVVHTLEHDNFFNANTSRKSSAKENKTNSKLCISTTEENSMELSDAHTSSIKVAKKSKKKKIDTFPVSSEETNDKTTLKIQTCNKLSSKKNKKNVESISVLDDGKQDHSQYNASTSTKKIKNKNHSESTTTGNKEPMDIGDANTSYGEVETIIEQTDMKHDEFHEEEIRHMRKRKLSAKESPDDTINKDQNIISTAAINQKKKRKISYNDVDVLNQVKDNVEAAQEEKIKKPKKRNKHVQYIENKHSKENLSTCTKKDISNTEEHPRSEIIKSNIKRKARADDEIARKSKILKLNDFDKLEVPLLPPSILKKLDDKPKTELINAKRANLISTTQFVIEETKKKKKPSNYLEQSVYINDSLKIQKTKSSLKGPKVLPFIPTASTSDSGFTTKFRIHVTPQEPQFVAQSSDVTNFKHDYLHKKMKKKLGTFEKYKRQRNIKISKF